MVSGMLAAGPTSTQAGTLAGCAAGLEALGDRPAAAKPPATAAEQERWLRGSGGALSVLAGLLYGCNWLLLRGLFRLRAKGLDRLPEEGPVLLVPNHASYLDPLAVAAALPLRRLRRTYWAGAMGILFTSGIRRFFSRVMGVPIVPVSIRGAYEALPPQRRLPRLRPIEVVFGRPRTRRELAERGHGEAASERIADALRASVAELSRSET